MSADNHAVYPNAPVALVTIEVRFPGAVGAPLPAAVQRAFGEILGSDWVYDEPAAPLTLNIGLPLTGQPMIQGPGGGTGGAMLRFADRVRTTAVALTAGSVSVETTDYENWPAFRSVIATAVRAAGELLRPAGVNRVGLRYIDEIRVPGLDDPARWSEWLNSAILPPTPEAMSAAGDRLLNWNGASLYGIGEDRSLVLRYGPQPAQPGFSVNPDGPLRRLGPRPQGAYFLMDFDSFWQPSRIPIWANDEVTQAADELRRPVRALFDELITERLVSEVFSLPRSQS